MASIVKQAGKFSIAGAIGFAVDYVVLMLLSFQSGMNPVVAAAISFIVANTTCYFIDMRFVFTHRSDISRRREFLIFFALAVIGLGINELIIWIAMHLFVETPVSLSVAKVVASITVTIWNFLSRRRWLDADVAQKPRA